MSLYISECYIIVGTLAAWIIAAGLLSKSKAAVRNYRVNMVCVCVYVSLSTSLSHTFAVLFFGRCFYSYSIGSAVTTGALSILFLQWLTREHMKFMGRLKNLHLLSPALILM